MSEVSTMAKPLIEGDDRALWRRIGASCGGRANPFPWTVFQVFHPCHLRQQAGR
jgi:hypothetical protein